MRDPAEVLHHLADEVRSFRYGAYALADDLFRLGEVHGVGAVEATILYCARILEGLSAASVSALGEMPSDQVFGNLLQLQQLNVVPRATLYWAHALRRLGNETRHLLRRLDAVDAQLALLFAERWLEWYFLAFRRGPRLRRVARGEQAGPVPQVDASLRAFTAAVERFAGGEGAQPVPEPPAPLLRLSPTLPAVLAEALLDSNREARPILERALAAFPEDVRLRQLLGLALSRAGEPRLALSWLEPLAAGRGLQDPETAGILAGVYKRLWDSTKERSWLEKARGMYREGWRRTSSSVPYLGVNAAATSLWLGDGVGSRRLAAESREVLLARQRAVARIGEGIRMDVWDRLSLAEARLLCGEIAASRALFDANFREGPGEGVKQVALAQLERNLAALRLDLAPAAFPAAAPAEKGVPFVIGVVGHRELPPGSVPLVQEALRGIVGSRTPPFQLVALGSLAEGADRIVATALLQAYPAASLRVILPLEVDDYLSDFATEESKREFRALLARAEEIRFTDPAPRPDAYARAGRAVADGCDLLLALWDGGPARGPGGTAGTVAYARERGRAVRILPSLRP
ncbi:MAG: tetratricopeptide repeat-containing protein [Planctomycetaceae bacterium]